MFHEDAILEMHPQARNLQPVRAGVFREIIGWTFEVPEGVSEYPVKRGWVTLDGAVSRILASRPGDAERNLRAYLRSRPVADHPAVEVLKDGQ